MSVQVESYVNGYVDGQQLVLISRDASGRVEEKRVPADYCAYFRRDDEALSAQLRESLARMGRGAREEGEWLRVSFRDGWQRKAACFQRAVKDPASGIERHNPLLAAGVQTYEADLSPLTRYLVDNRAAIQKPRRCYLDIETDSRVPFSRREEARVLCWSLCDERHVLEFSGLREESDADERRLMHELWEVLRAFDQIAAWNGDGFDFPVIWARSARTGVRGVDVRRWIWVDQMRVFKKMNLHVAESGAEKRSMKLESIAQALLGRGKADFDVSKTYEAWAEGGELRRQMYAYNAQDTLLLPAIEEKTGYLSMLSTISEVCKLFPTTGAMSPTRQLDGYMLQLAREKGVHFRSVDLSDRDEVEEDQFKGAFVMKPLTLDAEWRKKVGMETGILRAVHVADFSSMYPNIILTWNMSPETLVEGAPVNGEIPEGLCRCPKTGTCFRAGTDAFFPGFISKTLELRKEHKKRRDALPPRTPEWYAADRFSNTFKVLGNSGFGATGNEWSRFHERRIAEGITQNGAWLIEHVMVTARGRGWEPVYGDTDSIFITGCTAEEFAAFVKWCNEVLFPDLTKRCGCARNYMKLGYEKSFDRLCFTAAKRYAGSYTMYQGTAAAENSEPEIKGLEYNRGDATAYAGAMQRRVVSMILSGESREDAYIEVLQEARRHCLEDELPLSEVAISKGLSRAIDQYAQKKKPDGTPYAQPPHVVVAKILRERGREVGEGTRVEYVVVDDEQEDPLKRFIPAEDFAGECDRHYVWESLVYPPTERLLAAAFPKYSSTWDRWSRSRPRRTRAVCAEQTNLF